MKNGITETKEFKAIISQSRAREIHELSQQRFWGNVIVYGEPGIGKTALLEAFAEKNPVGYLKTTFLRGYEVELDESLLTPFMISKLEFPKSTAFPELLVIDDFDQIISKRIRTKVSMILEASRAWGYRVILSARKQINEEVFESNAHVMRLKGLNEQYVRKVFDLFSKQSNKHPDLIMTIRDMLSEHEGNPALIVSHLIMLVTPDDFLYRNPLIIEELQRPAIIQQNIPPLITDLRIVNQRILDRIGRRPEAIKDLSPRQFEELVAELFLEKGYQVELTQQTRDGGKDLIIMNRSDIGNFMVYAECKHYRSDRPVGVDVVTQLFGRINFDRATAGMVVTSSYFSADARDLQSKIEHKMSLIDFVKLSSMIETYARG
jgi:hypothetical protein